MKNIKNNTQNTESTDELTHPRCPLCDTSMLIFGAGNKPYTDGDVSHCVCPGCQFDTRTDWHKVPGFKGWCQECGDTEVESEHDTICALCADEHALLDELDAIRDYDHRNSSTTLTEQEKVIIEITQQTWLFECAETICDMLDKKGFLSDDVGADCSDTNRGFAVTSIALCLVACAAEEYIVIRHKKDDIHH